MIFSRLFFYKIFINCQYGSSSWQVSTPGGQNYSFPHISNTSANCFQANLNNGGIVRTWGHTIIYVVYASLCQCWIKMTKKEVIWISYHNYQFVPLNLDLYLALHKHIHVYDTCRKTLWYSCEAPPPFFVTKVTLTYYRLLITILWSTPPLFLYQKLV